tara:strand:+ start:606 stop:854 length:249 start_codon:yes stop_codon:yes gene_type:complete
MLIAKLKNSWCNINVKNTGISIKEKIVAKYLAKDEKKIDPKSSDINVLLNRIKVNKKNESRKKIYFSTAASAGLILFGLIIF